MSNKQLVNEFGESEAEEMKESDHVLVRKNPQNKSRKQYLVLSDKEVVTLKKQKGITLTGNAVLNQEQASQVHKALNGIQLSDKMLGSGTMDMCGMDCEDSDAEESDDASRAATQAYSLSTLRVQPRGEPKTQSTSSKKSKVVMKALLSYDGNFIHDKADGYKKCQDYINE